MFPGRSLSSKPDTDTSKVEGREYHHQQIFTASFPGLAQARWVGLREVALGPPGKHHRQTHDQFCNCCQLCIDVSFTDVVENLGLSVFLVNKLSLLIIYTNYFHLAASTKI